jgi:hypothetical protein
MTLIVYIYSVIVFHSLIKNAITEEHATDFLRVSDLNQSTLTETRDARVDHLRP